MLSLENQLNSVTQTAAEFRAFTQKQMEKESASKDAEIASLKAERKQAVTDGDGEAYEAADNKIEKLNEEKPVESDPHKARGQAWVAENDWYRNNEKLHAYANGIADVIDGEGYNGAAYFAELTRRTKEAFPEEFESKPNAVEGGAPPKAPDAKPHSFESLPKEDQAQYHAFVKMMPDFTQEEFLAQYDWSEE